MGVQKFMQLFWNMQGLFYFPTSTSHSPPTTHTTHTNNVCSPYRTIAADAALYRFTPISDKSFAVVVVLVVVVSLPVLAIVVLLLIISL